MTQILHIFRKDTRRFWPEILVALAVLVAFVCMEPVTWNQGQLTSRIEAQRVLASALLWLVPLSWWLLLARVVQAESLVGENQAWLTRPYEWTKLLAAKALFCVAYVYVPLLVGQCLLLREAGFAPHQFAGGLAYNGVLLAQMLLLPLFAVAALTANFARMTLTLLGLLLGAIGIIALALYTTDNTPQIQYAGGHDYWFVGAVIALFLGVLMLQYRTRRTWLVRGVLLGPLLGFAMFGLLHHDHPDVEANYPVTQPGQAPALNAVYAPAADRLPLATQSRDKPNEIDITLPVDFSGIPPGYGVEMNMAKAILDAPGIHWESPWQGDMRRYVSGLRHSGLYFKIDKQVYQRLHGQPVALRVRLAMGQLKAGETTRQAFTGADLTVGDRGFCAPISGGAWNVNLECRFALRASDSTYITGEVRAPSCGSSPSGLPHLTGASWLGGLSEAPANIGISPVKPESRAFETTTDDGSEYSEHTKRAVCPGTVLAFTPYHFERRRLEEMVVHAFVLPELTPEK